MPYQWAVGILVLFAISVHAQTVDITCTALTAKTGSISGNFSLEPYGEMCWTITPNVGNSKRPTTISILFGMFDLSSDCHIQIYTGSSTSSPQYGDFYSNPSGTPPTFEVISTSTLLVVLQGDPESSPAFDLEWQTGSNSEYKTAVIVLVSVIIMLIIPLVSFSYVSAPNGN